MENETVNILMVDDRVENLLALEAVLDSPNYSLISATSGEEALKWILKKEFAVILLDVQMPGLDGFETAKLIRAREKTKEIPIIFLTALSQTQEHVMHGYSVGAIDYMFKPFPPLVLKSKVEGFVSIYLNQKKIKEQNKLILKHTRELEEAYKKVKRNEAVSKAIMETSRVCILTVAEDGTILSMNSSTEETFGYSSEELLNSSLSKILQIVREDLIENLNQRNILESEGHRKDGSSFPVDFQLSLLSDLDERVYVCFIRDLTEWKQQYYDFIQDSEKLAVAGELAAGIAHEIRNPLTSLRGFTQLLEIQATSNREYVDIMISEIDRINTIVGELLLLAKPSLTDFERVDLYQLLEKITTLMSAQANLHGVEIHIIKDDEVEYAILGLENKLKQVFINLLKNSIEAMPGGGNITVYIRKKDGQIAIQFVDQGKGIPKELIASIGRPFFTTKETGTGLGMMVCLSIIESHQGTMVIESDEGMGTTIEVTLNAYESINL